MKQIIVTMLICFVLFATGCTTAYKFDNKVGLLISQMDTNMNLDCRAGLTTGITAGSRLDTDLRAILLALNSVAKTESPEYKKCFGNGAYLAFVAHGSADLVSKAIQEVLTSASVVVK